MKYKMATWFSFCITSLLLFFQGVGAVLPPFLEGRGAWAQQTLEQMSLEEKVGQLFMISTPSSPTKEQQQETLRCIEECHVGGLLFLMQGHVAEQVALTNLYQSKSLYPLLVAQDLEWGLNMRLHDGMAFPRNLTLGAIREKALLYQMGLDLARQCRRIGVHVNFAPVVDLNTEAKNPIINDRSFGENPQRVAELSIALMQGMQQGNVLACAKHFPGHGASTTDSHHDLPVLLHSKERLYEVEIYPFRRQIEAGVGAVMTGHLAVPALGEESSSALSPHMVSGLLRRELAFRGLSFPDALNMGGGKQGRSPQEIVAQAYLAGHDVLLAPEEVEKCYGFLLERFEKGEWKESDLDSHVLRILKAKEWLGLASQRIVALPITKEELQQAHSVAIQHSLYTAATTLVKNQGLLLPLQAHRAEGFRVLQIGGEKESVFLRSWPWARKSWLAMDASQEQVDSVLHGLKGDETLVVGVFGLLPKTGKSLRALGGDRMRWEHFGMMAPIRVLLRGIQGKGHRLCIVLFGTPYALDHFANADALVVGYEEHPACQEQAVRIVQGTSKAEGSLPVTVNAQFVEGLTLSGLQ